MTEYLTLMLRGVHSLFTSGSQSKPPQDTFLTKVYQSSKDQPLSSSLRNVQQTASEGSIEKISFAFLSTFNDRSDCKLARKAIAEEVLKEGVDWVNPVDWKQFTFWKQFALMLCPGFILRTPFEGGSTSSSIEAALFHTSLYKGTRFFSGNIRPDILKKIDDSLNHLKNFLNLLPFKSDLPINKGDLESYSKAYLEGIKKKISEDQRSNGQGTLYITLGYRGGRLNPGHAIPCKITEEEEDVVLTLFNLGNGSDAHPILNYTLNQEKMSYCFLPIRIKKELFYGDLGKAAFCYLLRYLADAPPNDSSYDGNDIYDIFCQFFLYGNAAVDPSLGSDLKKYEADGQISGNCTEVAVRNIIQDILIDHNISKLDREKYFLNRDFCALIAAHQAIASCDSYHSAAPQLLHEAAKFFGATVLSFYDRKEISEQELVRAQAVVHQISRGIKNLHPYGYSQQPAHSPEETYVSREFPRIPLFAQVPTSDDLPLRNDVDVHRSFLPILIGDPCSKGAEDFSMKLGKKVEEWIETANNLPFEKVFRFVFDCIRKLPIPLKKVESEVDPWERIELDQVKGILKTMNAFLYQGLKGVNVAKYDESSLFFDQFIMIYTVYAISDKLARRSEEETKLGDYSSPFFPEPFLFSPNGFTPLPLKEDNDRFTRIKKYFGEKQSLSRFIFPISPILNVHQFVDSHLSQNYTREQLQGRNHIEYLSQFIFHSEFGKTEERLAQTYSSRWIEALPAQVYYLYYSSFLSHLLFSAPGKAFPEKLEFSGSRLSGQDVLKIKNPFFLEGETTGSQLFTENHQPKLDQPIRDPRFFSSGGKESNGSFIDLDSPEIRDLTTNEALCYSLSEEDRDAWNISEADIRTLLNITRKDNLMFFQALQEFSLSKNHHLFNHPGVQAVLDRSFFQPGFIFERMEQEQDTLTYDFRQLIRENLRRYNNDTSQLSGILFLLRTGISFETYTSSEPYWVSRLSGKDESRLFTDKSREPTFLLYKQTIEPIAKFWKTANFLF